MRKRSRLSLASARHPQPLDGAGSEQVCAGVVEPGEGVVEPGEDYQQLRRAITRHLHHVADFVEFDSHDRALESFRNAMAISSELEIDSAKAPADVSRRPAPER